MREQYPEGQCLFLRGGDQNLLPTMSRSLSVPDSGPLWDLHTSASSQSGEWPPCPTPPPGPLYPPSLCCCPPLLSGLPHSASDTHWSRGAQPKPPSCTQQEGREAHLGQVSLLPLRVALLVRASAAAFRPAGGEASLWDIPINSSTQGPILEQLQLQHKVSRSRLTCEGW